jgi:hypothetical protein
VVERNSLELHLPGDVTVIEEDCGDIEIPRHIFEFVDFDNLRKRNGKEVYSGWFIIIVNFECDCYVLM